MDFNKNRKPCVYFFMGTCNREECKFSHVPLYKATIAVTGNQTKESVGDNLSHCNPVHIVFKTRRQVLVGFSTKDDLISALNSNIDDYVFHCENHKCYKCGCAMKFAKDGRAYYRSSSTTGSKGDWDYIGKRAVSDFCCGACNE